MSVEVKKHYLSNKDLYLEIIECKKNNKLTRKAEMMFILLTSRVCDKLSYLDIEDKKDCIGYAHLDLFKYWRNFDPSKSNNAFAYYTQIIKRGLAKGWNHLHPKKYEGTIRLSGTNEDSDGIYTV